MQDADGVRLSDAELLDELVLRVRVLWGVGVLRVFVVVVWMGEGHVCGCVLCVWRARACVFVPEPEPGPLRAAAPAQMRMAAALPVLIELRDAPGRRCTELTVEAAIDSGGRGRPRVTFDVTQGLCCAGVGVHMADGAWGWPAGMDRGRRAAALGAALPPAAACAAVCCCCCMRLFSFPCAKLRATSGAPPRPFACAKLRAKTAAEAAAGGGSNCCCCAACACFRFHAPSCAPLAAHPPDPARPSDPCCPLPPPAQCTLSGCRTTSRGPAGGSWRSWQSAAAATRSTRTRTTPDCALHTRCIGS